MSEQMQFRLPDVGEGLTEADIVSWHVKPGDPVTVNQVIVEIETAKAVVELPCPFEGVVSELFVEEGQTVDVGTPIIAVDVAGAAGATAPAQPSATASVAAGPLAAAPRGVPREPGKTEPDRTRPGPHRLASSARRSWSATASSRAAPRAADARPWPRPQPLHPPRPQPLHRPGPQPLHPPRPQPLHRPRPQPLR